MWALYAITHTFMCVSVRALYVRAQLGTLVLSRALMDGCVCNVAGLLESKVLSLFMPSHPISPITESMFGRKLHVYGSTIFVRWCAGLPSRCSWLGRGPASCAATPGSGPTCRRSGCQTGARRPCQGELRGLVAGGRAAQGSTKAAVHARLLCCTVYAVHNMWTRGM